MKRLSLTGLLGALLVAQPGWAGDMQRAERNYRQLLSGEKQFHQLSIEERQEVIEFDRLLRANAPKPETKKNCEARINPDDATNLERALTDLKCSGRP